ncbi:MAG: hypothetical protein U0V74_07955 [Chitinophagales bacterium]
MLDQLIKLVAENAQDAIVNNNAVPNQFNEAAISETTNTIQNHLSQAVSQGNLQDVLGLFGNAQNMGTNPLVGNIVSQLSGNLSSKFGVGGTDAQGIAAQLVPLVLGQLVSKTNNPNDSSFNINDIMSNLSGGKGASGIDFGNIVSQMQQGGAGVDLGGLASQFLGDGKQGGLGDVLGGFLGK